MSLNKYIAWLAAQEITATYTEWRFIHKFKSDFMMSDFIHGKNADKCRFLHNVALYSCNMRNQHIFADLGNDTEFLGITSLDWLDLVNVTAKFSVLLSDYIKETWSDTNEVAI